VPTTYEPIATNTLSTTASSIEFTSISGSYTDLVLVGEGTVSTETTLYLQFNSDTGSNYSSTYLLGDGSAASSGRWSSQSVIYLYNWKTGRNNLICQINNYSNTTTNKTTLTRLNTPSGYVVANVGLWRSTSAITSIKISHGANFNSTTQFTLYGIKAA